MIRFRSVVTCSFALAASAIAPTVLTPALLAQSPANHGDTAAAAAFGIAASRAQAALAADRGQLWHARLDTLPWMGVASGHIWLTADPGASGYTRDGSMWTGPLPAGMSPANTSVTWSGRRWAMVVLPVPSDSAAATRLLVHEAMHVEQPSLLPTPRYNETGAGSGVLDEADGRTWLRLEWRALAAALRARAGLQGMGGRARKDAVHDALLFRAARYAGASADEIVRERALDVTEGLPEYTAWRITRAPRSVFITTLDSAALRLPSFVRGFPYYTGPAYALLLDDYEGAAWRRNVHSLPDLQRLLLIASSGAHASHEDSLLTVALAGRSLATGNRASLIALATTRAARYDGAAVRAQEDTRWTARQRQLAEYRTRFVNGPTLRVHPRSLNFSFDPRGQASLGDAGTIMANVGWKGPDGASLSAPAGALVTPTWSELRVPLGSTRLTPGPLSSALSLHGEGWSLELPQGWVVTAAGGSFVVTPPIS